MKLQILFRVAGQLVAVAILATTGPQTLRDAANSRGIFISAAVRDYALPEADYSATLGREYNMVEPENAMKWSTIRAKEGVFDFRDADVIVRFAQVHGMKVRGHCLVWDHDNPAWLEQGHFTPVELSHLIEEHIRTVMKHYAGQVLAWDVVNEGIDEKGHFRDSPWYNKPGIGLADKGSAYVEQVFRWAHEADPHAWLFYNEAMAEGLDHKSDVVYAMVKDFKQRGVPIDGVGIQLHVPTLDIDTVPIAANIKRLTALGVQVHITELDVALPVDASGAASGDDLQRQAEVYRRVVHACVQNPGCTAIQTWGFTDKYSWIRSHSHGTLGAGLPFDRDYRPKPAYDAIRQEILSAPARVFPQ